MRVSYRIRNSTLNNSESPLRTDRTYSSESSQEMIQETKESQLLNLLQKNQSSLPSLSFSNKTIWEQITEKVVSKKDDAFSSCKSPTRRQRNSNAAKVVLSRFPPLRKILIQKKVTSIPPLTKLLLQQQCKITIPSLDQIPPLRRRSCICQSCNHVNCKQNRLPNQGTNILMHRKVRLANILLSGMQTSKSKNNRFFRRLSGVRDKMIELRSKYSQHALYTTLLAKPDRPSQRLIKLAASVVTKIDKTQRKDISFTKKEVQKQKGSPLKDLKSVFVRRDSSIVSLLQHKHSISHSYKSLTNHNKMNTELSLDQLSMIYYTPVGASISRGVKKLELPSICRSRVQKFDSLLLSASGKLTPHKTKALKAMSRYSDEQKMRGFPILNVYLN